MIGDHSLKIENCPVKQGPALQDKMKISLSEAQGVSPRPIGRFLRERRKCFRWRSDPVVPEISGTTHLAIKGQAFYG